MIKPPALYRQQAPASVDPDVIANVLALELAQSPLNVHSVYSLRHLAHLTSSSYSYLRSIASREVDAYNVYSIRKRDGTSLRSIAAPHEPLQAAQRWLLDFVFSRMETHPASYAYTQGRSVKDCATQHIGAKWIVHLDLKDFFHQTDEKDVYHLLRRHKYSRLVSFELARIVTRHTGTVQPWLPSKYASIPERQPRAAAPYGGPQRLGYLPQGAPTSGAIANALANRLDRALAELGHEIGGTYTRYADDLTFSSSRAFDRPIALEFLDKMRTAVSECGYEVNHRKTRVVPPGRTIEVLGLLVDGDRVRLPVRVRKKIEFHLRGLQKFGITSHQAEAGFDDAVGMLHYVRGLIDYAHGIEPARASGYYARLAAAVPIASTLSNK